MKVLIITSWYPSRNNPVSGLFVKRFAEAISLYDQVIVFHATPQKIKGIYEVSMEDEGNIKVIRLKCSNFRMSFLSFVICTLLSFIWLSKNWKKFSPDILHAHVYTSGLLAVVLGKVYNIPVVITEHVEIIDKYKKYKFRKIRDFVKVVLARLVLNNASTLVLVSKSLRRHVESFGIFNKCEVIPNVINIDIPIKVNYIKKDKKDKKRIIFIGILTPRKGVDYLLEAVRILRNIRNDFIVDIVGDGPYFETYKSRAIELGIIDVVRFHGRVDEDTKLKLLQESDFLVLPSLYETFGVVLIEAMALGKPVVTTSSGGQKEFVDEKVGVLIPPKDAKALAKAIGYMLDRPYIYPPKLIADRTRRKFNYKTVGKQIVAIHRALNKKVK